MTAGHVQADAVICLGDTLTHLPDFDAAEDLLRLCAARLVTEGRLALSFRDYSGWQPGDERRFEVRSDLYRQVDCLVTVGDRDVDVEDVIREFSSGTWSARSHRYRKLRLRPEGVEDVLLHAGMRVERLPDPAGMARLLAIAQ